MARVFPLYLVCTCTAFHLLLCVEAKVECNTTELDGQTLYNINASSGSNCVHSWASDHNIADSTGSKEPVLNNNSTSLLIRGCLKEIRYVKQCGSKMYKVTCTTTCTKNVRNRSKPEEPKNLTDRGEAMTNTPRYLWIAISVAAAFLLVFV